MSVEVVTPPDGFPVTLDEAKKHVRLDLDLDDVEITQMLDAAVEYAQKFQGRQYLTATIDEYFDCFPRNVLELELAPVQSITSITYLDTAGDSQTWASASYQSDLKKSTVRIKPVPGETWPLTENGRMNAVTVRYVAGYGNMAQVPRDIKNGFLMLLADLYENRSGSSIKPATNFLSMKRRLRV